MAKSKVSIKDIADRLGVSKTAVSFILNGKSVEKRISEELTKKVLDTVAEMGYKPNLFARGLRTGKSHILGLMVEDISNPFFARIAKYIEVAAYQNGYKIIYCSTENDSQRSRQFLEMFYSLGVDGCIVVPTLNIKDNLQQLIDDGVPLVLFDRTYEDLDADYVMVNNFKGTFEGTTHLLSEGFKNVALITVDLDLQQMKDRADGYAKAVLDTDNEPRVFKLPFYNDTELYTKDIEQILTQNPEIEAVVFATNYLGVQGLKAVTQMGLKIPEDLGIVCFDDNDFFKVFSPNITAISQPLKIMSEKITELLLDAIGKADIEKQCDSHIFDTEILIRESSIRK